MGMEFTKFIHCVLKEWMMVKILKYFFNATKCVKKNQTHRSMERLVSFQHMAVLEQTSMFQQRSFVLS